MRITDRDFDLMTYLAAQGVATSNQLASRFFGSRGSCRLRLSALMKRGIVESLPLQTLMRHKMTAFLDSMDIFSTRRLDPSRYKVYRLTERFRHRRLGSDAMADEVMWKHQIQLNGVRTYFEDLFPGALMLNDPEVRREWERFPGGREAVIPDIVIRDGGHQVAVEVERNLKNETAYFARFLSYRDSTYTHVLYFCETEKIFKSVSGLAARFEKIGVSSLLSKERIYQAAHGFISTRQFLGLNN